MDFLFRMWNVANADEIAYAFCLLIVFALAVGLLVLLVPQWRDRRLGNYLPTFMTTLGLLGTFVGILMGLLDFDVSKIDASVPKLLAGLKTAFITSIVGIGASIFLRLVSSMVPRKAAQADVSPEDIYNILSGLREDSAAQAADQAKSLDRIREGIAAEGDGSLLSQIQKLRTEHRDGQKELIDEFRDFARHMVENNQKALIEALKEVISDFNQNLTEQFGENFKELNAAVHKLVDWQQNYRVHVDTLEERLTIAVTSLEKAEAALREIETHTRSIPENTRTLEPILTGLAAQTKELEQQMTAMAALRQQTLDAFPAIERNLKSVTDELATHVQDAVTRTGEALQRHSDSHRRLEEGFAELQRQAADAQATFNQEMTKGLDAVNAQLLQTVSRHGDMIEATARDAQKVIAEAWEKTGEDIDHRMESLDDQMQQEMKRAIEAMGSRLASVSEKFVSDYGPLADRLSRVVRIAEGVRA